MPVRSKPGRQPVLGGNRQSMSRGKSPPITATALERTVGGFCAQVCPAPYPEQTQDTRIRKGGLVFFSVHAWRNAPL